MTNQPWTIQPVPELGGSGVADPGPWHSLDLVTVAQTLGTSLGPG